MKASLLNKLDVLSDRFEELTALLKDAGLRVTDTRGLSFSPATGFTLAGQTDQRLH